MKTKEISRIDIPIKCNKDFEKMKCVEGGRHCQNCNKIVHDLSNFTNTEIIDFLEIANAKVCAKLSKDQITELNKLRSVDNQSVILSKVKAAILALILVAASCKSPKNLSHDIWIADSEFEVIRELKAKDHNSIRGVVVDLNNEALIFAEINMGEEIGNVRTDLDGRFQIEIPNEIPDSTKIKFSYIGFTNFSASVNELKNKEIKITMVEDQSLIGEVIIQRRRKTFWKRIKNIFQ